MLVAITREISPAMQNCELTHFARVPIDLDLAARQHEAYRQALAGLGCCVVSLPAEPDLPDSVFVEDVAVVVDEAAIITHPGAVSRRPERESITAALTPYRKLCAVQAPGTVDGGDVLRVGKALYVGLSTRSNAEAVRQMSEFLAPYGYTVTGLQVDGYLHLKSAVTQVAEDTLLVNPAWIDPATWPGMKIIAVDPEEHYAANAVWIGDAVIFPTSFPKTRARLEAAGIRVVSVDVSELQKAEGAVTCCSLIFKE